MQIAKLFQDNAINSKTYIMFINIDKGHTNRWGNLKNTISDKLLEQVDSFPYSCSLITADIWNAQNGFNDRYSRKAISTSTNIRLLNALVQLVEKCGCESWTKRKADEKRINAFKMKCLELVLRLSWPTSETN